MRKSKLALAALALMPLAACGSGETEPAPKPTETVRTCESIREGITRLAGERGVTIVKIYEPTPVKIEPKKVSCTGRAVVSSGQEAKIYYRAYQDQEGDWLLQYAEEPLEK